MPIIYSLVAKGTLVLAEYTTTTGNFTAVSKKILEKIPSHDSKMSYTYDQHIFHYLVKDGITFLCMADEAFGRRIPFAFLEDVSKRFFATYGSKGATTTVAYAMNADFARVLQGQMHYYSFNPVADKVPLRSPDRIQVAKVRGEVEEVKDLMSENIEKILQRGEKIELLVDQTDTLRDASFKYKKQATNLKRAMWWKNMKLTILIVAVIVVLIWLISSFICGFDYSKCTPSKDTPTPTPTPTPAPSPTALEFIQ